MIGNYRSVLNFFLLSAEHISTVLYATAETSATVDLKAISFVNSGVIQDVSFRAAINVPCSRFLAFSYSKYFRDHSVIKGLHYLCIQVHIRRPSKHIKEEALKVIGSVISQNTLFQPVSKHRKEKCVLSPDS